MPYTHSEGNVHEFRYNGRCVQSIRFYEQDYGRRIRIVVTAVINGMAVHHDYDMQADQLMHIEGIRVTAQVIGRSLARTADGGRDREQERRRREAMVASPEYARRVRGDFPQW